MGSSADGWPGSEPLPGARLISLELELPVVTHTGEPPLPDGFERVWRDLCASPTVGWRPGNFSVTREHASPGPVISPLQAVSTDTGPVIELVTSPAATLDALAAQLASLRTEVASALDRRGCAMLGVGVHPALRPVPADYYRYRTPRPAYDYAIAQRGWRHWSIVDKAAVHEAVDLDFADAPRAIGLLHRLAGLMNFVLRNDPGLHRRHDPRLSVRPLAWRAHVPRQGRFAADACRVLIPHTEVTSWQDYLSLLWASGPMFLVGAKNSGQAYVPEHPTFIEFMADAPQTGWPATQLDGRVTRVVPAAAHAAATDWSYMGFARIRWKWRPHPPAVGEIVDAWRRGAIEELLERCLEKVVIENRGTSTPPPGEELVSVALVAGLLANLEEATRFARTESYAFWTGVLDASTRLPLSAAAVLGRAVPDLAREMVAIARRGLVQRGEPDAGRLLDPLLERIEDGVSPAERRLDELRNGGAAALIHSVRVRP